MLQLDPAFAAPEGVTLKVRKRLTVSAEDYERRINRLWATTDLPALVWDTPNWRDGWRVMMALLCRYDPLAAKHCNAVPDARWENEVHILSHVACKGEGHTVRHLAIEEEGTRLILEWWRGAQR